MDKKHAREQVRAQIAAPVLYRVFNIAFAVVFFAVVVLAVLMNPNVAYYYTWYGLLGALAAGTLAGLGASRLFMLVRTSPKKNVEVLVVAALMALMALLQVYAIWGLLPKPAAVDDFGSVYTAAAAYATDGTLPGDHLLINPTHTGTYTLLAGFFSLLAQLGVANFTLPAAILNTLAIDGAVLLLYFCGRRLWSARRAIFLLAVAAVSVPFLLYAPVAYSYTLALPFVTGMVLLWLKARSAWRGGNLRGAVVRFCVLSALAGAGGLIKATVLIVWIAIALDLLFLLSGKGRLRLLLAGLGCAALIFVGGTIGLRYTPLMPAYEAEDGFPLRGFVMMGLGGTGGYSADDLELVMEQDGSRARATFINAEIAQRLRDMGFGGVLEHLGYKIGYTYGDGTAGAAQVLEGNAGRWSSLHEAARPAGLYFGIMAYLAFAVQAALLAWTVVGAVKSVARKNDALTFARIALFGLFLFLLAWKTSPGELVCFLPLFMLCAVEASPMRALVAASGRAHAAQTGPAAPPAGMPRAGGETMPEPEASAKPEDEPDHWPEFPEEPAAQPVVQPVVLPAYYANIQPDIEQPADILPTRDSHRTPTEGGWVSGLGEEYRITSEDVGLENTQQLPAITPDAAAAGPEAPVEYDTDELEQWPEPQFPPADVVPPRPAAEAAAQPAEETPLPEPPQATEADAAAPVLEGEQPRWVPLGGDPEENETAGPIAPAGTVEMAEPADKKEPEDDLPGIPENPESTAEPVEAEAATEPPAGQETGPENTEPPPFEQPAEPLPEAGQPLPEIVREAARLEELPSSEAPAETDLKAPFVPPEALEKAGPAAQPETSPAPQVKAQAERTEADTPAALQTPPQPPQPEAPPESIGEKPAPYSVEAISDALEAELTLREVLREVLPPKKPPHPDADPLAPAKLGSWDPSRPLPVNDDEVSRILSEISAGKNRAAMAAQPVPVPPAGAAPVAPPAPAAPAQKPSRNIPRGAGAKATQETPWEGGLEALRNKHFDDVEDFDISVLLTGKPTSSERILPDAQPAAQDTLQQQLEAGLVQHPLAEGKAQSRGTEVWNAKYNTWQDYQAPMWPSAPGKWEKAPVVPQKPEEE